MLRLIAYICFLVWHLQIYSALWGVPVILCVYLIVTFILLPRWDQKRMLHKIHKYCRVSIPEK